MAMNASSGRQRHVLQGTKMTNQVAAVVAHGFGQPNNERLGSDACGVGVHLSTPQSPYSTALLAKADALPGEERHMMLCRIIMGRAERVEAGSVQHHPSSEEFDSGMMPSLDKPAAALR
ncbi:putative inactive poly [Canna indica]|uniref:Inactive poly n=1 Tax=Canna indica TaxID=4628 RepID=A0AAQ3Q2J6_9LILI|nr:putative inactive poly [Canna indica]